MRLIRFCWLILILLLSKDAGAAQLLELADGESAPVRVSRRDLTRIAIADGGKIARLWGRNSQVSVETDPEAGQVFVRPLQGDGTAFALHVRSERGATYTLLAVPADIPADTIFIRERIASGARASTALRRPDTHVVLIKQWIRALALDGLPPGTRAESVDLPVPLWQETELRLVQRVYGPGLIAERYLLRNVSSAQVRLHEREFADLSTKVRAVAVDLHVLEPGESAVIYLLRENEDE